MFTFLVIAQSQNSKRAPHLFLFCFSFVLSLSLSNTLSPHTHTSAQHYFFFFSLSCENFDIFFKLFLHGISDENTKFSKTRQVSRQIHSCSHDFNTISNNYNWRFSLFFRRFSSHKLLEKCQNIHPSCVHLRVQISLDWNLLGNHLELPIRFPIGSQRFRKTLRSIIDFDWLFIRVS